MAWGSGAMVDSCELEGVEMQRPILPLESQLEPKETDMDNGLVT